MSKKVSKKRFRSYFKNLHKHPLIILPPLIYIMAIGWNGYLYSRQHLSVPTDNLLANGNFTEWSNGQPNDWQVVQYGAAQYALAAQPGHVHGKSLQVTVSRYENGDVDLLSPIVNVASGTSYLFKGYYNSNSAFDLLARYYFADGTSQLKLVQTYPVTSGQQPWSTASLALSADSRIRAVQLVYRFTTNTTMELSGAYLEARAPGSLAVPTTPTATTANFVAAAPATDCPRTPPAAWSTYHAGSNSPDFSYTCDPDGSIYHVGVTNYESGEAKWQYAPLPVLAAHRYCVSLDYRGTTAGSLVGEFTGSDGERSFSTLQTLNPSGVFTHVDTTAEAPSAGTALFTAVLQSNGTLDMRNLSVRDCTRPGPATFQRPLLSIAFDGGRASAYQNGASLLAQQHLPATYYVSPINLDTPGFMTSKNIAALRSSGNEIASQGLQLLDLTTINDKTLDGQLHTAQLYIKQLSKTTPVDFAAPYGLSDAAVQPLVARYYQSQRGTTNGINTRQNFDRYNLKVLLVGPGTQPSAVQTAIQQAKALNAWLIVVYHGVDNDPNGSDPTGTTPALFAQDVAIMQHSSLPVVTVQQAMAELAPQL